MVGKQSPTETIVKRFEFLQSQYWTDKGNDVYCRCSPLVDWDPRLVTRSTKHCKLHSKP